MSVPIGQASAERLSIEQSRQTISRQLLAWQDNATHFNAYLATFEDSVLLAPPYEYTADEVYALRRFGELTAALALIGQEGGTMTGADATLLQELVVKAAGTWLITNSNTSGL